MMTRQLNYNNLNEELIEKQLNATKFFQIYFKKGSNFSEEDFFLAKKEKDDFHFDSSSSSSEMVSEAREKTTESDEFLTVAVGESEPEIKEENSQIEIEVEELNLNDEVKFESFV